MATLLERNRRAPARVRRQVAALLGRSKQAVSTNKGLLRLEMRDGSIGYPVFRFEGDRILPGIRNVVLALSPVAATSFTVASWLTGPTFELGGDPPLGRLRRGGVSEVAVLAGMLARA